jgi:hypothetical protein
MKGASRCGERGGGGGAKIHTGGHVALTTTAVGEEVERGEEKENSCLRSDKHSSRIG